ncbi:MAG: hypothetical protein ABI222_13205 [Opitutaceae bacterium]
MAASAQPLPPINKLVLAVHGIGDQTRNSTILSTAEQFCRHYGYRALLPLGGFHDSLQNGRPPLVVSDPGSPGRLTTIGFSEIYWADLARKIETAGFTLQETKDWCRSVVSRIRVLAERREPGRTDIHYGQIEYVIDEAIDAISVIESLLFLARKAGILDFNLKRVLDDYLGDVQLVTEFTDVRASIVGRLHEAFSNAHQLYPTAEIYVVAHSEGTVVAWLGLLEAATDPVTYPWITQVRGFMTIGSPIDKHLILWPALFTAFHGPAKSLASAPAIRWLNYVDNGDPVGFELDTARWWMHEHGYDRLFNFTANDDFYFTRYYVPGKAHTDYWEDADVFQHFILTVVAPPTANDDPPPLARRMELVNGPRNRFWAKFTSYVIAYLIPLAAVFAAVYFLTKGVDQYLDPKNEKEHLHLIRNVFALGILLAGTTVWLRVTQLVRAWGWHVGGAAIFATSAALYYFTAVSTDTLDWFGALPGTVRESWSNPRIGLIVISLSLILLVRLANSRLVRRMLSPFFPASLAVAAGSTARPPLFRNTITVMLVLGVAALIGNAAFFEHFHHPAHAPLWPIALAGAAFLYLWRLAALVFDLVFVWHRYIRHSGALTFLRGAILPRDAEKTPSACGGTHWGKP